MSVREELLAAIEELACARLASGGSIWKTARHENAKVAVWQAIDKLEYYVADQEQAKLATVKELLIAEMKIVRFGRRAKELVATWANHECSAEHAMVDLVALAILNGLLLPATDETLAERACIDGDAT